jgi:ComF family protein
MARLESGIHWLLDLIYPPRCVICQRLGDIVCATCLNSMQPPAPPLCEHCGTSLAGMSAPTARLCPDCAANRGPMRLDGLRAAAAYEDAARKAVLALKFGGQQRVAERLAILMQPPFQRDIQTTDMVIPVPLHRSRQRERSYNQAEALARAFVRLQRLPLRIDLLQRTRATQAQSRLSREERRRNVVGAFALSSPAAASAIAGKRILLIDDVSTTGSTLDAAAEPLRAAGAASVWGLAFARPGLGASDADGVSNVF